MLLGRVSSDFICAVDAAVVPPACVPGTAVINQDDGKLELQYPEDSRARARKKKNFVKRLKYIQLLLISTSNLRQKYLNRRVPLERNYVESLRKERHFRSESTGTRYSQQGRTATNTPLSSRNSVSPSEEQLSARLEGSTSTTQHKIAVLGSGKERALQYARRNRLLRRSTLISNVLHLEGWHDLLAVDPADHGARRVPTPPWQVPASDYHVKTEKNEPSTRADNLGTDNPAETFAVIQNQLQELKTYQQNRLQRGLVSNDREKWPKNRKRLQCLKVVRPSWHQQLELLRRVATLQGDDSLTTENFPKWFIRLQVLRPQFFCHFLSFTRDTSTSRG